MNQNHFAFVNDMRKVEQAAFASGTSYYDMMKEAGNAAADCILRRIPESTRYAVVVCGRGNNGGDGFVVANRLADAGFSVLVLLLEEKPTAEPARQAYLDLYTCIHQMRLSSLDHETLSRFMVQKPLVVDAVYGIGYRVRESGEKENKIRKLWNFILQSASFSAALDVVSWVEADSGRFSGQMEPVDLTIALGCWKPCHLVHWRRCYEKEEILAGTSLSRTAQDENLLTPCLSAQDFRMNRLPWGHKGTNGRLLLFCGSRQYPGAAVLATGAALRSGVGYACITSAGEVCEQVGCSWPEAVQNRLTADEAGGISPYSIPQAVSLLEKASAVTAGCGLGNTESTFQLIKALLANCTVPLVLDADALNVLEGHLDLLETAGCPVILTPHPGELSRILKGYRQEKETADSAVRRLQEKCNVTVVCKDAFTTVLEPDTSVIVSFRGSSGLARGGSGDVLAGLLGSMLAQGQTPAQAIRNALWLHGRAAELTAGRLSPCSMLPSDLIASLSDVFREADSM